MAIELQDVLKASFVLAGVRLLPTQEELREFQTAVATDVVATGFGISIGSPADSQDTMQTLAMNRDRITLELSSSRSVIARDYPSELDLDRLADVTGHAITATESPAPPTAFGYNIELVYDQDSGESASLYLGRRLFRADLQDREGWVLSGGAGKISYAAGHNRWNVSIDPRFNDDETSKVFFTLNMHYNQERLPRYIEIVDSLRRTWAQAMELIVEFDEGGAGAS